MSRLFLLFIGLCFSLISHAQAKKFELSIELKCYKEAGILATLTNASGRTYTIPSAANGYKYFDPTTAILVPEKEMKDNSIKDGTPQLFFYYEHDGSLHLKAGETYQLWVPISQSFTDLRGITPKKYISELKRIRFRIEKFRALSVNPDNITDIQMILDTVLYSNWVDVSNIKQ